MWSKLIAILMLSIPPVWGQFCEAPRTCTATTNVLMRVCNMPDQGCHLGWDLDTRQYEFGYTTLKGQHYKLEFYPINGYKPKLISFNGDQTCKFNEGYGDAEGWSLVAFHQGSWRLPPGPNLAGDAMLYYQNVLTDVYSARTPINVYFADDVSVVDNGYITIKQAAFNVTSNQRMLQCEVSGVFTFTYVEE